MEDLITEATIREGKFWNQFELGCQLAALLVATHPVMIQADPEAEKRSLVLHNLNRSFQLAEIAPTADRLFEDCSDNAALLYHKVIQKIGAQHGQSCCALVMFGYTGHVLKLWSLNYKPYGPLPPIMFEAHWRDNRRYANNLSLATDRLEQKILMLEPDELSPRGLGHFLQELRKPLTILMLTADVRDEKRCKIDAECCELASAIQVGPLKDALDVQYVHGWQTEDITVALAKHKPTILYFSGHGDSTSIVFEDELGNAVEMDKVALADLLAKEDCLELVILSACDSQEHAQAVANKVGCAITMKGEIKESACLNFLREFYRGLADGKRVKDAFQCAVSTVRLTGNFEAEIFHNEDTTDNNGDEECQNQNSSN